MSGKAPEMQHRAELRELNLEFLGLIGRSPPGQPAFGLDGALCDRIRRLPVAALETIADTPCLLAGFPELPPRETARGVAEPPPGRSGDAVRLYSAALLTYLWQAARHDPLLAALCLGPDPDAVERFAAVGFRDINRAVAAGPGHLEARFCRHPRLWPDLLRAAGSADPEIVTATWLSVVQVALLAPPAEPGREPPSLRRIPRAHPPAH